MANDLADALQQAGYQVEREYYVPTPGGFKPYRFVDVAALDPVTGQPVQFVQVGLQTKGGFPVIRESEAISDIFLARPDVPIDFVPYEP